MQDNKFPPDVWSIIENKYQPEDLEKNASIFFIGNGYLGMRGGLAETTGGSLDSHKGTFINGFYETGPQLYAESAYGFPEERQVMLNLPDSTEIRIYLDDEPFCLDNGRILEYERSLMMKEGLLSRELLWESPEGRRMRFRSIRCVSFSRQHLALISCSISEVTGARRIRMISSCYTGTVSHKNRKSDPRTGAGFVHLPLECVDKKIVGGRAALYQRTVNSALSLGTGVSNIPLQGLRQISAEVHQDRIDFTFEGDLSDERTFKLDKYIAYYSSIEAHSGDIAELVSSELSRAENDGGEEILREQREHMKRFWDTADVVIDGEDFQQQGIRYNIFALYQSAGRDGRRNIAAKGLSGEGYEGHYFWDTEIYVIPFFTYNFPEIARELLQYRYSILDQARKRAEVLSEKGALFPWRTINGVEASAYFPAGTAQYHINADIAYGIQQYTSSSGDFDFLKSSGAEILVETSRLWMSLGFFGKEDGRFRINSVTGPDEYTAIVNNNYFTNIMAANNLEYSCDVINGLRTEDPAWYAAFSIRLGLAEDEPELWRKAAELMYLPYDAELAVHSQDDSFMQKELWDFTGTPPEKYPLLLHYHPLVIYRHQVLKQPDVVLANFLLSGRFTRIQKMRDFDYYNPLTTGDSSLSPCIQSIMASELGRHSEAYDYFVKTVRMDLDDINLNVADGVHIAAMGGSWLSIIYGFAGLRESGGILSFDPRLPDAWNGLEFRILSRGSVLQVEMSRKKAVYTLVSGDELILKHRGIEHRVKIGSSLVCSTVPRLRAVIFDLDGVITDSAEYHYLAWKKLAVEEGFSFSREINEKLRGIGRLESLEIILEFSGISLPKAEKERLAGIKNNYYRELISRMSPRDILSGINDFIGELKSDNIKIALASASKNAPEVIEGLGLSDSFDIIIDAASLEKGKPDPEIFVLAAEKLGFSPSDCAGVEDAEAGVSALKAAGIFSVGIGPAASGADWVLGSTDELDYALLRKKLKRT
ncbi:MAG: beta-phosphoglucomutase [Spirochaetales bacterium]|nr:beta-phosphoglucomutase [Spirochaetales bacterium]